MPRSAFQEDGLPGAFLLTVHCFIINSRCTCAIEFIPQHLKVYVFESQSRSFNIYLSWWLSC